MSAKQISTVHDAKATRDLRAKILESQNISDDLAGAVADVLKKHGIVPTNDQLVAIEPVVTRIIDQNKVKPFVAGSTMLSTEDELSANIHVVESRSVVRSFAVTQSAWL